MDLSDAILTGHTDSHVVEWTNGQKIHLEIVKPLKEMARAAAQAGYQIEVCSGYRSFPRQVEIWNAKSTGKRPLLDSKSQPVSIQGLTEEEIIHLILRWSALPGASRHHWGTDLDIIDASRVTSPNSVKLVPEEFQPGGPFCELHDWLDVNMNLFGFFRPYQTERGGVSPERWHLSYAPLAQNYLSQLSEELVSTVLEKSSLELKGTVLKLLPDIFRKYVTNLDLPL